MTLLRGAACAAAVLVVSGIAAGAHAEAFGQVLPAAPKQLVASATGGNGAVALRWSPLANAASYDIYVATAPGAGSAMPLLTGLVGTHAAVTGLQNGRTYYFTVMAIDGSGQHASSSLISATPTASASGMPVPDDLSAAAGSRSVTLSWSAVAGATSYDVYSSTSAFGMGFTVAQSGVTTTSATLTKLTNGTPYYFTVVAVGAAGQSDQALDVSATPSLTANGQLPAAPTQIAAQQASTPGGVVLKWPAVSGADSYTLYVGSAAGSESSVPVQTDIAAVNGTATATVTGLSGGQSYYFRVSSVGKEGQSAPSAEIHLTVAAIAGSKDGGGGAVDPRTLAAMAGLAAIGIRRKRRCADN